MGTKSTKGTAGRYRWAIVAPLLLLGCNDHPLEQLDKVVTSANRQGFSLPQKTKIDFLFMIDDSGSMCEEQENLTRNFSLFSDFLAKDLGQAADYRIAVVDTDLRTPGRSGTFLNTPAAPTPSLNCVDPVTNMPKAPDTADCADLLDAQGNLKFGKILKSDELTGNTPAERQADLERKFRCMATLGTNGDGFEKGLEAVRLSLSCDGPNKDLFGKCCNPDGTYNQLCFYDPGAPDAPQFLRPDAVLVVVLISDEVDCSDPASNPAASKRAICKYGPADGDGDGVPNGYADGKLCQGGNKAECFRRECGGLAAEDCYEQRCVISRSDNSNCEWFRDNLTPIADYEEFLIKLKRSPADSLVVASIVGLRDFTPQGFEISYNPPAVPSDPTCDPDKPEFDPEKDRDLCCPAGKCEGAIQPSCESANGVAFSGRRYLELAERFGFNGIGCTEDDQLSGGDCVHICTDDFSQSLLRIRDQVARIVSTYCLDKRPACFVRRGADGQPLEAPRGCETDAERANVDNYSIAVQRGCRDDEVGAECRDLLAQQCGGADAARCEQGAGGSDLRIRYGSEEYEINPSEPACPSGFQLSLRNPPPAGSEVFLEFQVDINAANRAAPDAGAPAEGGDAAAPAPDAAAPAPDAGG